MHCAEGVDDNVLRQPPGVFILGQEHCSDGVLALGGQFNVALFHFGAKEPVGGADEDSGAVAGGGVCADRPAVGEVGQNFHRQVGQRDGRGGGRGAPQSRRRIRRARRRDRKVRGGGAGES